MTGMPERDRRWGTGLLARCRNLEETRLALEKLVVNPNLTLGINRDHIAR